MIKPLLPWLLLLISSCAIGVNNFSSIEKSSDFFLCFPETDQAYSQLTFKDKISIQKGIKIEVEFIKEANHLFSNHDQELLTSIKKYLNNALDSSEYIEL